jgi:hypothetical protein
LVYIEAQDVVKEIETVKVIEYLEGRYIAQEEPFGVAYKWSAERIVIECECGSRPTLTASTSICSGCGVDHALIARQELNGSREMTVDKVLHPWRYAKEREGVGLPF